MGQTEEDHSHFVFCLRFFLCFTRHLAVRPHTCLSASATTVGAPGCAPSGTDSPSQTELSAPLRVEFVSETVSMHTFHYLYNMLTAFLDHQEIDKLHGTFTLLWYFHFLHHSGSEYRYIHQGSNLLGPRAALPVKMLERC